MNIEIDRENKTWKLVSAPMFNPTFQVRYYDDIEAIFKSDPRSYTVTGTGTNIVIET